MENIVQYIDGNKLIIEIDLAKDQGVSVTGKSITIANSGFAKINHPTITGIGFKLNVWKPLSCSPNQV